MNTEPNKWTELLDTLKVIASWILITILDTAFFALWVATQWLFDQIIAKPLGLTGISQVVMIILQVLFGIATLAPVAITIYGNITIMWVRIQQNIRFEIKKGQTDGSE